ncbi:unnamed protein product [Didymodactylos carnosus]|uniref:Uncharacterized protein n=1 Tax=Didymodactylos carnosus TaxID=1234261 RepID=A0A815TEX2_9BILA|nr:unnamed protein product [Didymodactylos carnosus]CAF1501124.1 unnamed protein product [Didymodactylos carnosus]CAF4236667.1 unnamed protein product [Didymodactylos carnosus]CAF4362789.1 unnamed protein product [Didymodactylos carnosus]
MQTKAIIQVMDEQQSSSRTQILSANTLTAASGDVITVIPGAPKAQVSTASLPAQLLYAYDSDLSQHASLLPLPSENKEQKLVPLHECSSSHTAKNQSNSISMGKSDSSTQTEILSLNTSAKISVKESKLVPERKTRKKVPVIRSFRSTQELFRIYLQTDINNILVKNIETNTHYRHLWFLALKTSVSTSSFLLQILEQIAQYIFDYISTQSDNEIFIDTIISIYTDIANLLSSVSEEAQQRHSLSSI